VWEGQDDVGQQQDGGGGHYLPPWPTSLPGRQDQVRQGHRVAQDDYYDADDSDESPPPACPPAYRGRRPDLPPPMPSPSPAPPAPAPQPQPQPQQQPRDNHRVRELEAALRRAKDELAAKRQQHHELADSVARLEADTRRKISRAEEARALQARLNNMARNLDITNPLNYTRAHVQNACTITELHDLNDELKAAIETADRRIDAAETAANGWRDERHRLDGLLRTITQRLDD